VKVSFDLIEGAFLLIFIQGHANQWGEVKTKKSKKEAQKAKAATTGVSSHQQQSTITPYREPKITQQQQSRSYNNNDRVTRPGKGEHKL
jgi:hypothetical protein